MSEKGTGPIYFYCTKGVFSSSGFVNNGTRFGNSGAALFNVEVSKNGWYSLTRLEVFLFFWAITNSSLKQMERTDGGIFDRRCPVSVSTLYEINSVPYYRIALPVKLKFIAKKSFKHCPLMS